jgi:chitodextrinase
MANVIVTGTNSPNVNGTYVPSGTANGHIKYSNGVYMIWTNTYGIPWFLGVYATASLMFTHASISVEGTYTANAPSTGSAEAALEAPPELNDPPTVSITAPVDEATYTEGDDVTITANAADGDGTIERVEFFANGIPLGQDTSAAYSLLWENVAAGTYILTAIATDNDGASTESAPITITVNATAPEPEEPDAYARRGRFDSPSPTFNIITQEGVGATSATVKVIPNRRLLIMHHIADAVAGGYLTITIGSVDFPVVSAAMKTASYQTVLECTGEVTVTLTASDGVHTISGRVI